MDKMLTLAFDNFSVEEVEQIAPKVLSCELPAETLLRLQEKAVEKLKSGGATTGVSVRSTRRSHKITKTLLIAAIVAVLLAAGALAVWLSGSRFFSQLFGSEGMDIIGEYVLSDMAEANDGVLRLTLESALSDGHYEYVVFSVERLDGGNVTEFLPDVDFEFTLAEPSRLKPAWQYEKLDTPENSNSRIYCLAGIRSDIPITGLTMRLKGLYSTEDGHRELTTDVSIESSFLSCPLARGGESEGVIRNIELSPFSLWIDVYEPREQDNGPVTEVPTHGVALKFRDGETVGASAAQFADGEYLQSICWDAIQRPNGTNRSLIFIRFLPLDIGKVVSVVIDGVEYPVKLDIE